jgi:uncharacterized protein YkwD
MPESGRRLPRRVVTKTILLSAASLLAAAGLVAWSPQLATGWNQAAAEATLWQLMNGARVNNGVTPVLQHGTLVSLARWRSQDMLQRDYFSHTILGTSCQVYCYYDSNGLVYVWGGENIGWNSGNSDADSPVLVHEQFMASPGHRGNVLNPVFTHGGVGAWAADGIMFQGYVQNPRMYTELFMQAPSSGGSGGGGGGSAPPPPAPRPAAPAPAPAAPEPTPPPEPTPLSVEVAAPARPVSSAGVDGIAARVGPSRHDVTALTAADDALSMPAGATAESDNHAAPSLRVEAAAPAEPAQLDSILAAILGALFG